MTERARLSGREWEERVTPACRRRNVRRQYERCLALPRSLRALVIYALETEGEFCSCLALETEGEFCSCLGERLVR